jgi:CHAD domain-containing protein
LEAVQGHLKIMSSKADALRAEDPDAIHDMRVASRRLRAALAEYGSLFDKEEARPFLEQIRLVTKKLSVARELDVSSQKLRTYRDSLKDAPRVAANYALRRLASLRKKETSNIQWCADAISSEEFRKSFERMLSSHGRRKQCQVANAKRRVSKRFKEVVAAYERWRESHLEEDLHQLRIAFKKLRYTCETYQKTYGKDMTTFIGGLKRVQDWIGDWHDSFIIEVFLRECEATAPEKSAKGMPELQRRVKERSRALLEDFSHGAHFFFEPNARETALATFSSLTHFYCWWGPPESSSESKKR